MLELTNIQGLSFYGYKSYIDVQDTSLGPICNFNVIIGKNNTGKTSFIDIIEALITPTLLITKPYAATTINLCVPLDEEHLSNGFAVGVLHEFAFGYPNDLAYAKQFIGKPIILTKQGKTVHGMVKDAKLDSDSQEAFQRVANSYSSCFPSYSLFKIHAERDIRPEPENFVLNLNSNGEGASNLIRAFINQNEYKESLVEETLLNELNKIMGADAHFTRIQIQQIQNNEQPLWEIFLEEKEAGRFALSKSGSGLKTIILVLLNLLILPHLAEYRKKKRAFAFEELENNLHPALQRRLFDYLYSYSITNNVPIFLTTHSHVAIDMFYGKEHAQILHVTKQDHKSSIKKIDNTLDKIKILDDLAVKASDLFQSNGIIWVEGPSDRVYIKKWLEIFGGNKFQEGKDYQFLYYGGRLLEKYSAEELENKINIITTNHNSAIVIDSDKLSKHAQLNDTKRRIRDEFKNLDLFCWITEGKEIENYLPVQAINKTFGYNIKKQCEQYEKFPDYIKKWDRNFTNHKVKFAENVALNLTAANSNVFDVQKQIEHLYREISKWNNK